MVFQVACIQWECSHLWSCSCYENSHSEQSFVDVDSLEVSLSVNVLELMMHLGGVSSPLCVNELRLACSLTQLCQYRYIY